MTETEANQEVHMNNDFDSPDRTDYLALIAKIRRERNEAIAAFLSSCCRATGKALRNVGRLPDAPAGRGVATT
jgi:hypothetical protein